MWKIAPLCMAFILSLSPELLAQDKNDFQDLIKQLKDKGDIQDLIKQLKDRDESTRLKAAKDLSKLGAKAKDAIPGLIFAAPSS
ncbi:hypothetical protein BH10PLA2_BH10PLA2_29080 [soil metagenome]